MTVENITPYISYTSNGMTTTFAIPFHVEGKTNFVVKINGVPQNYPSYSYNKIDNTINFISIPARDAVIEIERHTALERSANYDTFSNKLRPTSLNGEFDRVWRVLQELSRKDQILQQQIDELRNDVNKLLIATRILSQDVVQFPITATSIRINIPEDRYATTEPIVVCTVLGGPTNVTIQPIAEYIQGVGEVYTHLIFTFPSTLIGKKCNAWLTGG